MHEDDCAVLDERLAQLEDALLALGGAVEEELALLDQLVLARLEVLQ